jgi:hypothetical protein
MDVEADVHGWVEARFAPIRTVTETPDKMELLLPVIKVVGLPGGQRAALGRPLVDVECFADNRIDARALALSVHNALLFEMRGTVGDSLVSTVQTVASPAWRPYPNMKMRRFGGTYQIYLH